MSDAQIDGGERGAQAQDRVDGFIGDKNDGEAVRWYGLYSGILSLVAFLMFNEFGGKSWNISAYWAYVSYHYFPVFMCWLLVSYFDGEFMRTVFGAIVSLSILGPFASQWV